jgi:hypothetical protein
MSVLKKWPAALGTVVKLPETIFSYWCYPFEMRTVLNGIRLFNDNPKHKWSSYLYETDKGERGQDTGETERGRVAARW